MTIPMPSPRGRPSKQMRADTSWTDIGNGESSAIVYDAENAGNYKALRVKPWPDGRWWAEVNGAFRGWAANRREARQIAIQFARAQINGAGA